MLKQYQIIHLVYYSNNPFLFLNIKLIFFSKHYIILNQNIIMLYYIKLMRNLPIFHGH